MPLALKVTTGTKHRACNMLTSHQNEYLMHGILLIASAHLRYLHPDSKEYSDAETEHLASTIAGLRNALLDPITGENADIITSCSLLLLQHAWSVTYSPGESAGVKTPVDIGSDNMLPFSAGLKSVLWSAWQVREGSIYQNIINPNMVNNFKAWAIADSVSCAVEEIFREKTGHSWPEFRDGEAACVELDCGLVDAIDRLTPILRAADCKFRGLNMAHLSVEASQYLLLWPGKCDGTFRRAVQQNDEEALLILLSFYLCTTSIASSKFWWVRDRSKFMSQAISEHLVKNHNGYGEKAIVICNYFGAKSFLA